MFPAVSVTAADTDHVPSDNVGRSHDVATPTVYEHDNDVPFFVAVRVTRSPVDPPATDNVGVASDVTLSVLDEPVSDPAARSGPPDGTGAVESM